MKKPAYVKELTGVLIVQNEAEYLPAALDNLWPHVSDLVVVDGGSTDETLALLAQSPARVFHRRFDYDFAAQRNYALAQVRTPWVITLDADEQFSEAFFQLLPEKFSAPFEAYLVRRYNSYLRQIKNPLERWYRLRKQGYEYQLKLFRSHLRYQGKFHEKIVGYQRLGKIDALLFHRKTISRQRYNEALYSLIRRRRFKPPEGAHFDHTTREKKNTPPLFLKQLKEKWKKII